MLQAISCNQGNMNHCIDLLAVIVIFFPCKPESNSDFPFGEINAAKL